MTIAIISVLALALLALALRNYAGLRVCPVCAGVATTWGWMLLATLLRPELDEAYRLPIAILMGASVSGGMYALSERIALSSSRAALWKIGFAVAGVGAVYAVIARASFAELVLYLGALALVIVAGLAAEKPAVRGERTDGEEREVEKIKNTMEECC